MFCWWEMQNFKANEHYVAHHKLDKIELHPYIRALASSVRLPRAGGAGSPALVLGKLSSFT